jgi:glyoxylase-like metal-dependent hydrolase (beta-lactamase superfamily II)
VRADEIEVLLVSHSHADHRGLAAEVVSHTGCRFAMGPAPHPIIDALRDPKVPLDERVRRGHADGVPEQLLQPIVDELPAGDEHYPQATPDVVLRDGETIASACGPWQVVALPGHSADQVGLWNAARRWLISADLALPGAASFLEWGTRPDPHADQTASLQRAIALQPQLLLSGHGRPAESPEAFLRSCLEAVGVRLQQVSARLERTPRSAWELASPSMSQAGEVDQWQRALIGTRAVLDHLRFEGVASCAAGEDGVSRWSRVS